MERRVRFIAQKRTTFKAQLTRIQNLLDDNPVPSAHVMARVNHLKELFTAYEELHDELAMMDEDHPHVNEFPPIQDAYFNIIGRVNEIMNPRQATEAAGNVPVNPVPQGLLKSRQLKLPHAELPRFDGKYDKWHGFKNTFQSMIGNTVGLDDVSKFLYLQACLKGSAANKIALFDASAENYQKAWNLLERSYEVKRLIVSKHIAGIADYPAIKESSHDAVVQLVDAVQQHVSALETLGVTIGHEMLVWTLEKKLPTDLSEKWDETLAPASSPKFNELCDFLTAAAIRMSKRDNSESRTHGESSRGQPVAKKAKRDGQKQAFMIHTSNNCPICKNVQHPLYRCQPFRDLSVQRRIQVVQEANLCLNCMRYHPGECKYGKCKYCDKAHNSMLHLGHRPSQPEQRPAEAAPAGSSQ